MTTRKPSTKRRKAGTPPRKRTVRKASRPDFPKDYGLLDAREGAGLFPWSRVRKKMAEARNYWICTTRPGGRPHAMPVWGLWIDDTLFFSTGRRTRKARNLAENPRVVAHLESGDDVVILECRAREVSSRAELKRLLAAYRKKYGIPAPLLEEGTVTYALDAEVAFAWRERDFPGSATRWILHPGPDPNKSR